MGKITAAGWAGNGAELKSLYGRHDRGKVTDYEAGKRIDMNREISVQINRDAALNISVQKTQCPSTDAQSITDITEDTLYWCGLDIM